jgi:hypothetical protein
MERNFKMFELAIFIYALLGVISSFYVLGVRCDEDKDFNLGNEAMFFMIGFSLIAIFFAIPMYISRLKKGTS